MFLTVVSRDRCSHASFELRFEDTSKFMCASFRVGKDKGL